MLVWLQENPKAQDRVHLGNSLKLSLEKRLAITTIKEVINDFIK